MRNQLRLVIGVIGALALALVLPGVAHAHHVPPIDFTGSHGGDHRPPSTG